MSDSKAEELRPVSNTKNKIFYIDLPAMQAFRRHGLSSGNFARRSNLRGRSRMAGPMQLANRAELSIPCATIAFSRFTFSGCQHAGPDARGQLMAFAVRALARSL